MTTGSKRRAEWAITRSRRKRSRRLLRNASPTASGWRFCPLLAPSISTQNTTTKRSARTASLHELIENGLARLIGPIRQELLSGIREPAQFERLRDQLRAFPDEALTV